MSAKVDAERAEMAREARFEAAKDHRRQSQRVAEMEFNEMPHAEQARQLGISRLQVLKLLCDQGLLKSKTWCPVCGRRGSRRSRPVAGRLSLEASL